MTQLPAGTPAPDFELPNLDGRSFRLSESLQDGPIVLVFYKIACPTCQLTLPYLERAKNPRIRAISQDEAADTRAFSQRFGLTLPTLLDEHPYEVSRAYNLEYVPAIFVVGKDGIIELSDYGFAKDTVSKIAGFDMFPAEDGLPASRPG